MPRKLPPARWIPKRWTRPDLVRLVVLALFLLAVATATSAQEGEPPDSQQTAQGEETGPQDPAVDASGDPAAEGDETPEGDEAVDRSANIFTPIQRFLRPGQSHLMALDDEPGWISAVAIGLGLVAAYLAIISVVLFVWRRARKPSFWKQNLEEIQGEGRWQCQVAYDIRRKVDAMLELKISQVEPSDASPQLACLVGDTIKGRIATGSTVKIGFPHLRPRNFWQGEHLERIGVGFELIQPRDRKVTIHLDCRVEYAIRKRKSTGGIFEVALEFAPTADTLGRLLAHRDLMDDDEGSDPDLPQRPKGIDDTAAVRVLAADLSGFAAAQDPGADAAFSGFSELDDLRRNLEIHDQRLQLLEGDENALPPIGDSPHLEPLRREIAASEGRLLAELEGRLAQSGSGSKAQEIESVWRELQSLEQRLTQAVGERLQSIDERLTSMPSPADGTLLQRAIDDLEQRLTNDIRRLGQLAEASGGQGGVDPAALDTVRSEMRSTEQRLVSDMRENIQVLASGLQGLRVQLTNLNTSVNDLMQRFVNFERRIAQHEQRIERLEG